MKFLNKFWYRSLIPWSTEYSTCGAALIGTWLFIIKLLVDDYTASSFPDISSTLALSQMSSIIETLRIRSFWDSDVGVLHLANYILNIFINFSNKFNKILTIEMKFFIIIPVAGFFCLSISNFCWSMVVSTFNF
jgi:hypothetical protein